MDNKPKTYTFEARGHKNITAKHVKTLEFSKDDFVTKQGDCIIGIKSNFELQKLKEFSKWVTIQLQVGDITDSFKIFINPIFDSNHELVIRKSRYDSPRTYGILSNKSSYNIKRDIVEELKKGEIITITITQKQKRKHQNKYSSEGSKSTPR